MMAVAALFMPLLFSCSGGSSSKNNLLGAIPDQYAQFVEEKAEIKKEAENIKTAEDKKALIEKSEKMTAKWKEKMEESAKALSGKPVEIAECNFNITEPCRSSLTSSSASRILNRSSTSRAQPLLKPTHKPN